MIKNLTFGSDPEYFVINELSKKIVSAIPIIDGTKEQPESLGDGFFIQRDNVLAEGNIPIAYSKGQFLSHMEELKTRIIDYIKAKYNVLTLHHADCLELDQAFLSHPEAMQSGCSPYLNAWDEQSHRAKDISASSARTCGFHLHIGYDKDDNVIWSKETINNVIAKAYDMFVVLPSCMIHVDQRRFENYGGLGQYRETSYGLELRSLGGFFVDEKYLSWVFDQLEKAIEYVQDEENLYYLMYMEKPVVNFKGGLFTFDSSVYDKIELSFNNQLIKTNKTIYA